MRGIEESNAGPPLFRVNRHVDRFSQPLQR